MEKETLLFILEDIKDSLNKKNGKDEAIKTINNYEKWLKIASNKKIQRLVKKQKEHRKKYGETNPETLKINKIIDNEIQKIITLENN